jgi:hypothetical protein
MARRSLASAIRESSGEEDTDRIRVLRTTSHAEGKRQRGKRQRGEEGRGKRSKDGELARRKIMEEPDIHKNFCLALVVFIGIIHLTNGSIWSPLSLRRPPFLLIRPHPAPLFHSSPNLATCGRYSLVVPPGDIRRA